MPAFISMWRELGGQMKKKSHLSKRIKRIIRICIICVICLAAIFGGYYKYAYIDRKKGPEPKTDLTKTNTDSIYSEEEFKQTLENYNFDQIYDLDKIVKDSYVIPGLKATRTLLRKTHVIDICTSMVPQGVCVADQYVLISAYCSTKEHNSVIYVLNRQSHDFVKEVVLKGKPHVGGIAYDPVHKNIWICGYNSSKKEADMHVMSLVALEEYSLDKNKKPCEYVASYPVYSVDKASFADYNDNTVYVGTFVKGSNDIPTIQGFELKKDGTPYTLNDYSKKDFENVLKDVLSAAEQVKADGDDYLIYGTGNSKKKEIEKNSDEYISYIEENVEQLDGHTLVPQDVSVISDRVQGCATGEKYVATSVSSGPDDSRLYIFNNNQNVSDMMKTEDDAISNFDLPPMLEQISDNDGKLYLCFESSAYIYRTRWNDKIDRVIVIDE